MDNIWKILGIINLALIVCFWIFMITQFDIEGKALKKTEELESRVNSLELYREFQSPKTDTIIMNIFMKEYQKEIKK